MNSNWGYYLIDHHTNLIELRTARSAMITKMSSVILDATASINYYYRLQQEQCYPKQFQKILEIIKIQRYL